MVSVSASAATLGFRREGWSDKPGLFDCRAFVLPKEEVVNYFIWRQQDCIRNAIQMVARSAFSHAECHRQSCDQLQEKLFQERDINFKEDFTNYERRGRCLMRSKGEPREDRPEFLHNVEALFEIPDFTKDREFIERYLQIEEE